MKNLILANPNAGRDEGRENAKKLAGVLIDKSQEVTIVITKDDDELARLSRQACGDHDRLFVLGGDGSINTAVNQIMKEDPRPILGILPSGTVNNFANIIGLRQNPDQALEDLMEGRVHKVDIGRVNDSYFVSSLATGLIAEKVLATDADAKASLGKIAMLKEVPSLISLGETDLYRIEMDGQVFEEDLSILLITTANSVYGIDTIVEDASPIDGVLNFLGLRQATAGEKLSQIPQVLSEDPQYSDRVIKRSFERARVELKSEARRQILTDGEATSSWPMEIEIVKNELEVIVGPNF